MRKIKQRKNPGPAPDPDWEWAIGEVTARVVAAGYERPLKVGERAAIQTMLLDKMAERDKTYSEDSARKYAGRIIAGLPDRSA